MYVNTARLQKQREALSLSIEDVAQRMTDSTLNDGGLHWSPIFLKDLERGDENEGRHIGHRYVEILADALEVSTKYLLERDPPPRRHDAVMATRRKYNY